MEPNLEPDSDPGAAPAGDAQQPEAAGLVRLGLIFYGLLLAVAVIWRIGFYQEPILYTSSAAEADGLSLFRDVGIGLAAGAAIIALSDWLTRATGWGDQLARELAGALGRLSVPDALLLALASGIAEETFFRGAVQPRTGWFIASILFGCAHLVPRRELMPWAGFAVGAGFVFAGLFIVTGNLVAPICAHVLVNAVNLPLLVRRYGPDAQSAEADSSSG